MYAPLVHEGNETTEKRDRLAKVLVQDAGATQKLTPPPRFNWPDTSDDSMYGPLYHRDNPLLPPPPMVDYDIITYGSDSAWDRLQDTRLWELMDQYDKGRLSRLSDSKQQRILKAWRIVERLLFEPDDDGNWFMRLFR